MSIIIRTEDRLKLSAALFRRLVFLGGFLAIIHDDENEENRDTAAPCCGACLSDSGEFPVCHLGLSVERVATHLIRQW